MIKIKLFIKYLRKGYPIYESWLLASSYEKPIPLDYSYNQSLETLKLFVEYNRHKDWIWKVVPIIWRTLVLAKSTSGRIQRMWLSLSNGNSNVDLWIWQSPKSIMAETVYPTPKLLIEFGSEQIKINKFLGKMRSEYSWWKPEIIEMASEEDIDESIEWISKYMSNYQMNH